MDKPNTIETILRLEIEFQNFVDKSMVRKKEKKKTKQKLAVSMLIFLFFCLFAAVAE